MTSQMLSIYITKLNHPLKEIRERSLKLLLAKLKFGWEWEDELSSTRDLVEALLNWFYLPKPSLQKNALDLLLCTIKTKSGTYIAKEIGIDELLKNLDRIKYILNEPGAINTHIEVIEMLKFLKSLESEENLSIPRLNLGSVQSSESDNRITSGQYNLGSTQSSKESSIISGHVEQLCKENITSADGVNILLFPWVEINDSDLKTMLLIEDALRLLKSVRRCCRFIRDVFLRDFPAEIFLNRPSILKNLVSILEGVHRNQSDEAMQVLLSITKALCRRKIELSSIPLIHTTRKFSEDHKYIDDNTNLELEQISQTGDFDLEKQEDGLAALRQLPAPLYALDTMHSVLSAMARNITTVDANTNAETLDLKELNTCVDLIDSLIQLLLACVTKQFWTVDHHTKTHRDIAHKSCMIMRVLGDLLAKYRKAFFDDYDLLHRRAIWLRLVTFAQTLLSWSSDSALPPSGLVTSLQMAQLDPALQILYPEVSEKVTLSLQMTKTSVDQEYKSKYRELIKQMACMDDAVRFMKNKNSCRDSKAVLTCIKKSLPVLELHMSEQYLNDVADILLLHIKDFKLDDSDWGIARSVVLTLLAHNIEWVQIRFYSKILETVKSVFIGDETNQTDNEKCLTILFDVGILTEICCHGLSSKTKQVQICATVVMLYFLRGRMVLSDSCWWRLLASLLPVLPLLHSYAAHDTQLGQAICKSLELDIASCMGVSTAATSAGLVRLVFSRCVAVQLHATRAFCHLLDDERYLPPKEALRADVLMSALRRVQPQNFNVDTNSSPSKNPQITGLLQILDVLKQDITLDEHGVEYISRDPVQPILEPSLRRSTLQQLAVMARQQDTHAALLQHDGLRIVVATLRMSLMVDDYMAFPECAISCVSILNSVCFVSRHNLAKITDLPALLIRVILVFPANDSVVLMASQVLALVAWSGFALQELDVNRKRVPALPACVVDRTALPFLANSYWNTSPNAEHSTIEWLSSDEEFRNALTVRWWCAWEHSSRIILGASPPPSATLFRPSSCARALLQASSITHTATSALLALENATAHSQVVDALCLLESYVKLVPWSSVNKDDFAALPWQHARRFLRAPPASSRDTALLIALIRFILVYIDSVSSDGDISWIKSSFIGNDATVISLLSRDQLFPQQTAQESIEVTQLHIHIVKVLLRCVKRLEYDDYDSNKLESLLKILLSCLERIDLKNFHVLGYLNELTRCIRYVVHSRYCKLSESTLLLTLRVVTKTLSGCASGGGRKGQACRLDAILSLLALVRQVQAESIPIQRWSEVWNSEVAGSVVSSGHGLCPQLRAAALSTIAALAHHPQLTPQHEQALGAESLTQYAVQIFIDVGEANIVRAAAADLLTAVTARVSVHNEVLESEVMEQLKSNNVIEHCLDILVAFCNEQPYENYVEPNVPLSVLERRSELEVRSQKRNDLVLSPTLVSPRAPPPPTPSLLASTADMLHNISILPRCPVQEWNERGLYRLLFRCASWEGPEHVRVRGAACRALVAAAANKCVRNSLAATNDCLNALLGTLVPLQEDEMYEECINAQAQALFLLATLLGSRDSCAAQCSLYETRGAALGSCLLCALLSSDTVLQTAALFCLTQLLQCLTKKQPDECGDESFVQWYDNVKGSSIDSARRGAGDDDCQPEYVAEDLCKVIITLFQNEQLENKKYQNGPDDQWVRVSSCLSSVLAASPRSRSYAVHRGFPTVLLANLQAVRDRLSVLGKPIETIRNANHSPILRTLYWLLTLITSSLVECEEAKDIFADGGIAISLNRLWPWCMMTEQLRVAVITLLFNFSNECSKAWSAMSTCVGGQNICNAVCAVTSREASNVGRSVALLPCVGILRHCANHQQCRAAIIKSDVLSSLYKAMLRERIRSAGGCKEAGSAGRAFGKLAATLARHADGGGAVLALRPAPSAAPRLLPALAHAATHHRAAFLQSSELLELLSGSLLAGDTAEMISAATAVWALAANNHKAKLLLRSAGVTAAVQAATQRLQQPHRTSGDCERALQLLTYTNTVLQTT